MDIRNAPFTPQIPNLVSMDYLGTPSYAGLFPSLTGAVAMIILILVYMNREAKKARLRGEHFQWPENVKRIEDDDKSPNGFISILPIAVVLITFNVTDLDIVVCLLIGVLLALILFYRYLPKEADAGNVQFSCKIIGDNNHKYSGYRQDSVL